ncbi:MAG: rhodanese-like domain-containing protein [Gammaproteobacteria bacterium]
MSVTAQVLVQAAKQEIREIGLESAGELPQPANALILDVREPEEFQRGAIPGAINIPRGLLEFRIGSLPQLQDPSTATLVYCQSGGRSALAAQTLQRMGYTNVVSLAGGYAAWEAAR